MAQPSAPIAGSWRLVKMGASTTPMIVPLTVELTADFSGERISGSGGCNRFTGTYQTKGNCLSIGLLASTRMACKESVMNQEMKYLIALQAAQSYEVNNRGQLTIFYQTDDEKSGVLDFTSQSVKANH